VAAAVVAAVGLALALLRMPPVARPVIDTAGLAPVRGVMHVHTDRSDGSGSVDDIAVAAARAGLDFVILTDHGDGAAAAEPPAYRSGVLVIDAIEISSTGGHVVALGADGAGYPLAGEARDVVEDIHRLGGFVIAAHPGSPRESLRWTDWDVPMDGLEWVNADSAWRDESPLTLATVLLTYPIRPGEALAALLDRPAELLARWDELTEVRRVVAVGAVDAHGRIGLGGGDTRAAGLGINMPSYESTFRVVSMGLPDVTFTGEAETDMVAVVEAVRAGRVFSSVDALASPGAVTLGATSGITEYWSGDLLPLGSAIEIIATVNAPPDARIDLLRDGQVTATAAGPRLQFTHDGGPAVYRVEVHLPWAPGSAPVPWLFSNPLYVGRTMPLPDSPGAPVVDFVTAPEAEQWVVEASAGSEGAIDPAAGPSGPPEVLLRYALSGRESDSPFVAFAVPAGESFSTRDRILFSVRADRPMRVDVQVRTPTPVPGEESKSVVGERWHRSVYVGLEAREVSIPLEALRPRGSTREAAPRPDAIDSLLFVVDTVNTPVGSGGRIWVSELRYGRGE